MTEVLPLTGGGGPPGLIVLPILLALAMMGIGALLMIRK
jgi:hypothetical protein